MNALQQVHPNIQRNKFKRKAKEGPVVMLKRSNPGYRAPVEHRRDGVDLSPVKVHLLEALERRQEEQAKRIAQTASAELARKEASRKKSKLDASVIENNLKKKKTSVSKMSPSRLRGSNKVKKLLHMAKEGFEYSGLEALRQNEHLIDDCELLDLPKPDWSPVSSYCGSTADELSEGEVEPVPNTPSRSELSEVPSTPPNQVSGGSRPRVTFGSSTTIVPKVRLFGSAPPLR